MQKYCTYHRKREFQHAFNCRIWRQCVSFAHLFTGIVDIARWRCDASDTRILLETSDAQTSWRHTAWRHSTQLGDRLRSDVSSDVMVRGGESIAWRKHVSAADRGSVRRWWNTGLRRRMEVHTWVCRAFVDHKILPLTAKRSCPSEV